MKLQQKIAFGLCLFYMISVIGVAVSVHFCGGKLSSVHFTETAKCGACEGGLKVKEHSCCKNTVVHTKVDDSHEASSKINLPLDFSIDLFLRPAIAEMFKNFLPNLFSKAENKAPPLSSIISLHAFYCVFLN